jgi:hypothetical protein
MSTLGGSGGEECIYYIYQERLAPTNIWYRMFESPVPTPFFTHTIAYRQITTVPMHYCEKIFPTD